MAQLTPLAKGLITVVVLGVAGSLAWNFGLKERFAGGEAAPAKPTAAAPAPAPTPGATTPKSTPPARAVTAEDRNAPLGSAANPLKVSLVSFHGYAPALVANGNDLNTQPGSIYAKEGSMYVS
jgi:NitT/TauT family transport system substrate-binding protein